MLWDASAACACVLATNEYEIDIRERAAELATQAGGWMFAAMEAVCPASEVTHFAG